MNRRPLILIAHGTANALGIQVITEVAAAAGEQLGLEVPVGYVDVCTPTAEDVLRGTEAAVVVPFFIGGGHHVQVDVPAAAALASGTTLTPHLGLDPALVEAAAGRLAEAGFVPEPDSDWTLVVIGAGSRRPEVQAEIGELAARLGDRLGVTAEAAFLAAEPAAAAVLAQAVARGRVAVANLLLAPGFFNDQLQQRAAAAGADVIARPLGAHPSLVAAVVQRYQNAVAE